MSALNIRIPVCGERTLEIAVYESKHGEPANAFIIVDPAGSCVKLDPRLLVEAAQAIVDHVKIHGVSITQADLTIG